jgi:hypothetical protein
MPDCASRAGRWRSGAPGSQATSCEPRRHGQHVGAYLVFDDSGRVRACAADSSGLDGGGRMADRRRPRQDERLGACSFSSLAADSGHEG